MKKILILAFVALDLWCSAQPKPVIQIVHNSADTSVASLKVWMNDTVWIPQLNYLFSSPVDSIASGIHTVAITHVTATSSSPALAQVTLQTQANNFLAIHGIHSSGTQYNPGNSTRPFGIFVRSFGPVGTPFILDCVPVLYHLATDVPSITVVSGADTLGHLLNYSDFHSGFISAGTRTLSIASHSAPIGTATFAFPGGKHVNLVSTGFVNTQINGRTAGVTAGKSYNFYQVPETGGGLVPFDINLASTGLSENAKAGVLQFYPSPTNHVIRFACTSCGPFVDLTFTDLSGRLIKSVEHHPLKEPFEISGFAKGIYLVRLESGKNVTTGRLVID